MIKTKMFTFNTFMVNTYLLYDESCEAVLVDAGCADEEERQEVVGFLSKHNLKLVRNINTHCHIDHILGNSFIAQKFGIGPEYHPDSAPMIVHAPEIAASFGYRLNGQPQPVALLQEGVPVKFGNSSVRVIHTPGHADGSVCFYSQPDGFVITGDVLFRDTIGRTDLPTGNFDLLMQSIRGKLFTLPDETVVLPGHGPETTIGYEKINNPFIR